MDAFELRGGGRSFFGAEALNGMNRIRMHMEQNDSDYQLVRMAAQEWRFETSERIDALTQKYFDLCERHSRTGKLTSALRRFLNEHPGHLDALGHYAMCKLEEGKALDAFAFAHTAVATGRRAFPLDFDPGLGTLPGGWHENRPFLRALHVLMLAQQALHDRLNAIDTGFELLLRDPEDRMGARMELPELLLAEGRDQDALDLFAKPEFEGAFDTSIYLEALAWLRVGDEAKAIEVLQQALRYFPQVARFLLDVSNHEPEEGLTPFGIASGSPYEGWNFARRYRRFWREPEGAMKVLLRVAEPAARAGWERRLNEEP